MKHPIINIIVLLAGISLITCTGRKTESPIEQAQNANEKRFDKDAEEDADRLSEAAMNNTFEMILADTASDKGSFAEVRLLGESLKKLHLKMNSDLLVLAAKKNITIPADLTKAQKRNMLRLSKKRGQNFDKDLVKYLRNKHEDAVNFYTDLAENSTDPDIKAFATRSNIEIQEHLTAIDACWEKIKDRKPPKTGVDRGDLR